MHELFTRMFDGIINEINPHLPFVDLITDTREGIMKTIFLALAGFIISNIVFVL